MIKLLTSIGIIGAITINQGTAFAGVAVSNMVNNNGATLRVECWSKDGKTTLKVNIVPGSNKYPISYLRFQVDIGGRRESVEQSFIFPTLDANAEKVIDGEFKKADFSKGVASGYRTEGGNILFHQFKQRGKILSPTCEN